MMVQLDKVEREFHKEIRAGAPDDIGTIKKNSTINLHESLHQELLIYLLSHDTGE